jgi:cytochrome c oxidase subunit 2
MNAAQWSAPAASSLGEQVDVLFYWLTGVTGAVALLLAILVITFCVRYRRGSRAVRGTPILHKRSLETGWIIAPLVVFLGMFAASSWLYPKFYDAPPDADTIYVIGKQWMWKLEHTNGRREIDELHVALGRPVRLVMISQDVIHSFFVPAMRFKQDLLPGRFTSVVFTPTRAGVFGLGCAEFCGAQHSHMTGQIVVLPAEDHERWLETGATEDSLGARGFRLYRQLGCSGCHAPGSTVRAPDLRGLFGRTVRLADGRTAVADESYLHDAILLPSRDIAAGYPDIMPSFAGVVGDDDLVALIAWLRESR